MHCICGFDFAQERMDRSNREWKQRSYALIGEKDYRAFIRSEMTVEQSRKSGEREKFLAAIMRSSKYTGSALKCPRCARLLLIEPENVGASKTFYTPEANPARSKKTRAAAKVS